MTNISKRQRARLYIYIQRGKNAKPFDIQKARHFLKRKTIFHDFFEIGICILKACHFALCDIIYIKIYTICKKKDTLRYVFIYKNLDTLRYTLFHRIFEIGGGGGAFLYAKNNTLCVIFLCKKKQCTSPYIFI